MKERHFQCKYCHSKFVHEERYLKHRCKHMVRAEEIQTQTGQAAWLYYQKWMKAYRRMVPPIESFMVSKYYQSFIRFTKQAQRLHLPDIDAFILLMKEKDISPTMWTNDQVYSIYLEYLDRRAAPSNQAKITINTLFKIADAAECDVGEVFDVLEPNEVIELLRERRLSPWLLLFSGKFKQLLINKTTTEQRIIMETIIRPKYWTEKFKKHTSDVELMKKYVEELGL